MTTTVFITKLGDVENKIPEVIGLVIATVLNTKVREIDNKIADVSGLVKKTNCNTKISNIDVKSDTGSDCNKCTSEILAKKIKEKGLVDKFSVSNLVKNSDFNTKLVTLATKAELKAEQYKKVKLEAFDSSSFVVIVSL